MRTLSAAVLALALGISGAALVSTSDTAWAQSVQIGPGGVRVSPYSDGYERRRGRRFERHERCRTIVERRRNRFGERVETRRRVCR